MISVHLSSAYSALAVDVPPLDRSLRRKYASNRSRNDRVRKERMSDAKREFVSGNYQTPTSPSLKEPEE
jgi:hypothetical protein